MIHANIGKRFAMSLCLLAGTIATSAQTLEPAPTKVFAFWRVQQLELDYRGHRTLYSCDGLRRKIAAVLQAIGAGPGLNVQVQCQGVGFMSTAVAIITVTTPAEATPENVQAATAYSAEALLVARLKGISLPTATDLERFPAQWQSVALHRVRALDGGDCDLLRALAAQVFPQLAVREENRLICPLNPSARMRTKFVVSALVPTPIEPVSYAHRIERSGN
jgi:hypothetical protein